MQRKYIASAALITIIIRLPGEPFLIPAKKTLMFPETMLHPKEAMDAADVILANTGEPTVVMTHSEEFVLRVLRRIKESNGCRGRSRERFPEELDAAWPGPIRPNEDVALFVIHRGDYARMRMNERGEIIDEMPGGFFEHRLGELI